MITTIYNNELNGKIIAPPSKSISHRALICAMLAKGESTISCLDFSEDVTATLDALKQLGVSFVKGNDFVKIKGGTFGKSATIDANESGSTLRFLIPICSALGVTTTFIGKGKLPSRTYENLAKEMIKNGASFSTTQGLPTTISNNLQSGIFEINGNISSQFITGLLFALPLLKGDSKIVIIGELESESYINLTIDVLKSFGITILKCDNGYTIKGNQSYQPQDYCVEGDFSNASFWLCAGALQGDITVCNLNLKSLQGDKKIIDILKQVGADITLGKDSARVRKSELQPCDINLQDIPDLAPILAVLLSQANGVSKIYNAERLKIKECDRLNAIYENLKSLGVNVKTTHSEIEIYGKATLQGGATLNGFNDHRIVMSMTIASLLCNKPNKITTSKAVCKSYPKFFEVFSSLGGKYE